MSVKRKRTKKLLQVIQLPREWVRSRELFHRINFSGPEHQTVNRQQTYIRVISQKYGFFKPKSWRISS